MLPIPNTFYVSENKICVITNIPSFPFGYNISKTQKWEKASPCTPHEMKPWHERHHQPSFGGVVRGALTLHTHSMSWCDERLWTFFDRRELLARKCFTRIECPSHSLPTIKSCMGYPRTPQGQVGLGRHFRTMGDPGHL